MNKNIITILFGLIGFLYFNSLVVAQSDTRPVLAVLNLMPQNISESDANIITGFIQENIFKIDRYRLVEREQVDKLLNEIHYQQSGVCDLQCVVNLGKQLSASKVITGTVGLLGNSFSIQLKLIDIEKNKIENIQSILVECQMNQLPGHIFELIAKFFRAGRIFNPDANVKQLIKEAILQASLKNKNILLMFGANWCPWSFHLFELL